MSDFYLSVNGLSTSGEGGLPVPSEFSWSRQDISAADSGRTEAGTMVKARVVSKDKINLKWLGLTPEQTAKVLTAFEPEYFTVAYRDPRTNTIVSKQFYCGDRSAPVYWWCKGGRYESVSFNIIEV